MKIFDCKQTTLIELHRTIFFAENEEILTKICWGGMLGGWLIG
jgi:hypothetical protein